MVSFASKGDGTLPVLLGTLLMFLILALTPTGAASLAESEPASDFKAQADPITLTIPATVVGAIYGMNVPLPGGNQPGPLTFLGPFTSFLMLMLIAWVPAILMVLYFHNKGWL